MRVRVRIRVRVRVCLKVIVRVQVGFTLRARGIVEAIIDSQYDSIQCRYGTVSNSLNSRGKQSKCD